MYTTVPVLKLAYLLISILMTLYTFLWCMGIRPSTSDSSSLFICFLLFWFLQLWLTGIVGEILELKKFSSFSLLAFFLFRGMHFSWLVKLLSSWNLYLPHQFITPSCGAWAFGLLQVTFPRYLFIFFYFDFYNYGLQQKYMKL